jgi:Holliday junction DNA helicase RuvA
VIAFVEGELIAAGPDHAIVMAGGVGFNMQIPLSTRSRLPDPGQTCRLLTRLVWREDGPAFFGFFTAAEAEVFDLLLRVTGVGPKIALSILSGASPRAVLEAVALQDADSLRRFPGVGRKTAERILLELKDKVSIETSGIGLRVAGGSAATEPAGRVGQAMQALLALGYSRAEAAMAVEVVVPAVDESATAEELIRRALQYLAAR